MYVKMIIFDTFKLKFITIFVLIGNDHRIGEGDGTPLQYSCLENPMGGGAWWAAVHGVAKSRTRLSDFTFMHWRRKWQPTPVFLLGESQGRGSLVGLRLWGRTELDTTEVTWQQQQGTNLAMGSVVTQTCITSFRNQCFF